MAQVSLFGTTGTYPNLVKAAGDVKYIFWPEPEFDFSFQKNLDMEDIPFEAAPIAYDPYTQNRTITIKGSIKLSGAGDPPGAKTLKERWEDLDKVSNFLATFSNQPDATSASEEVFCLEITMPSGAKQFFCTISSTTWKWAGGTTHMTYTCILKEVSDVIMT